MFKKSLAILAIGASWAMASGAGAADVPIRGTVESRCVIQTSTPGTYGNPNAYTLSTQAIDGGDQAVVRFDVTLADAYYAEITPPTAFSSSPTLPDVVTWTGDVSVQAVSDASGMGTYETDKLELGNTDRYTLTATGSTWFAIHSTATMGGNKAFPGGNYTAMAEAVCIAK
jgi:hypothetical protein